MTHTVKVVEPGRSVTFTSDSAATAVFMAREWVTKPTYPAPQLQPKPQVPLPTPGYPPGTTLRAPQADVNLAAAKPPTQVAQPQGFEAFGPMGERQ